MKYCYGNSYKEAITNPSIDITDTKVLNQYINTYNYVFPENMLLSDSKVEIEVDSCLADNIEDTDWMEDYITDYLYDKYEGTVRGFNWDVVGDKIVVTNICLDTD